MTGTVAIGYLHGIEVTSSFANSLAHLLIYEAFLTDDSPVRAMFPEFSGVNVSSARNELVRKFLTECDADWLLMIDSDMQFDRDALRRLMANADLERAPIVGALCFGADDTKLFPTLYSFEQDGDGKVHTVRYKTYPQQSMFQVGATGAAFVLVHRGVLQAVQERAFNSVYPWFQETELNGHRCGEDITFFLRAGICGYPVWVDTGVEVGHQKAWVLTAEKYREQLAREGTTL